MMKPLGWLCAVILGVGTFGALVGCAPADDKVETTQQDMAEAAKQWADHTPKGWQRVTSEKYTYAVPPGWKFAKKEGADTHAVKRSASGEVQSAVTTKRSTNPESLSEMKKRVVADLEKAGAQDVAPYKKTVNPAETEGAENSAIVKFQLPTDDGLAPGYEVLVHFRENKWIEFTLVTRAKNPDALFEKIIDSFIFYP